MQVEVVHLTHLIWGKKTLKHRIQENSTERPVTFIETSLQEVAHVSGIL
jgi:hypothetical protein